MTREESIKILKAISVYECYPKSASEETKEALDMAIEALHREEAEEKGYCHRINYTPKPCENANCDCVDVVRCKDCRYYWGNLSEDDTDEMYGECRWDSDEMPNADDFCSYGERQET